VHWRRRVLVGSAAIALILAPLAAEILEQWVRGLATAARSAGGRPGAAGLTACHRVLTSEWFAFGVYAAQSVGIVAFVVWGMRAADASIRLIRAWRSNRRGA